MVYHPTDSEFKCHMWGGGVGVGATSLTYGSQMLPKFLKLNPYKKCKDLSNPLCDAAQLFLTAYKSDTGYL